MHQPLFVTALTLLLVSLGLTGCAENEPPKALFRVRYNQQNLIGNEPYDEREYETYVQTQIALMTSPYVLQAAMRDPKLAKIVSNPVDWLSKNLIVEHEEDSEIVSVSLQPNRRVNAKAAGRLINAVARSYVEEIAQAERVDITKRLDLLRSTHRHNERTIQEISSDIESLKITLGMTKNEKREVALLDEELVELRRQTAIVAVDLETLSQLKEWDSVEIAEDIQRLEVRKKVLAKQVIATRAKILALEKPDLVSPELVTRKMRLDSLIETNREIAEEMSRMEMNLKTPPRVELIQSAESGEHEISALPY